MTGHTVVNTLSTLSALGTLISLLQENLGRAKEKADELRPGSNASLMREGRINGLEEAILVAEHFRDMLHYTLGWPQKCPRCGATEFGTTLAHGEAMFDCGERDGCGHLWRATSEAEADMLRRREPGAHVRS